MDLPRAQLHFSKRPIELKINKNRNFQKTIEYLL